MGNPGGDMTAKAVSKKIKAKGLGRLRWYCQMCEKQCRDENGFQNHMSSESHKRQLALFAEASEKFIDNFSTRFRRSFLGVIRQRFGSRLVHANTAYQEYIKDKNHVHMNATRWTTLSDFVKEAGRTAFCTVEERDDGWWIAVIDQSAAKRSELAREMDRERLAEEERSERVLMHQMALSNRVSSTPLQDGVPEEPEEIASGGPIGFDIKQKARGSRVDEHVGSNVFQGFDKPSEGAELSQPLKKVRKSRWGQQKKMSTLQEIMQRELSSRKQLVSKSDNLDTKGTTPVANTSEKLSQASTDKGWLSEGIIVRVKNQTVGGGVYYNKKGVVTEVIEVFGARVELFESGALLELDQDELETVVPKEGGTVLILVGPYRGKRAKVLEIKEALFSVSVRVDDSGNSILNLPYGHLSRVE